MLKQLFIFGLTLSMIAACPDGDQRCASCVQNQCRVCFDGYINAQGECQKPQIQINHCLEYVNETTCKYCQHEYYVNNRGSCSEIKIDDCIEVDQQNPDQCLMCEDNIFVRNGKCDDDNKCKLDHCDLCTNQNGQAQCAQCKRDYTLQLVNDKVVCVKETSEVSNCFMSNQQGTECQVCDINYYYSNGKCVRSNDYTASYDDDNVLVRSYNKVVNVFDGITIIGTFVGVMLLAQQI